MNETIRIDIDDGALDIIDVVNKALARHGLRFVDDNQDHDGFMLLVLLTSAVRAEPLTQG